MEASQDLRLTLAESAVALGGRRPVLPTSKDGVVVQVGSRASPGSRLQALDRETGPLRRLDSCSYKRTSAEPEFRQAGLAVDWCAFRILNTTSLLPVSRSKGQGQHLPSTPAVGFVGRSTVQRRQHWRHLMWSLLAPAAIFLVLNALLAFILLRDATSQQKKTGSSFVDVLFDVLHSCLTREAEKTTTTHVVLPSNAVLIVNNNNEVNASSSSCHSSSPSVPDLQQVGAAGVDLRGARASSVQRQTDTLRSLARRRDITPRLQPGWERSSVHSRSRTVSPCPSAITEGGKKLEFLKVFLN